MVFDNSYDAYSKKCQYLDTERLQTCIEAVMTEKKFNWCLICFVSLYQRRSSALPSALSSPYGGSQVHFVSHPSLFPAPPSLSGNVWHPHPLAFSHTCHIGFHLCENVRREQRWGVKWAGVMGRRQNIISDILPVLNKSLHIRSMKSFMWEKSTHIRPLS